MFSDLNISLMSSVIVVERLAAEGKNVVEPNRNTSVFVLVPPALIDKLILPVPQALSKLTSGTLQ